ncbi:MAG: GMC family oxidoreductase N-terminal domain-containing protein [Myxococcota bacterium]
MAPTQQALRAEVVVIGSGAGGAPVAARLAEAGRDVVLVEAGPHLTSRDFTGVEGEMVPRLMTARVVAASGMELYAGRCVGGSTVVNDALCWRTPPEVLARWRRDHGLSGLDESVFGPLNDRVWSDIHASPGDRAHLNRNAHKLEVAAARMGWQAGPMHRNVRGCANLGQCNFGCPANAKQSTLVTYVPRARRAGARLLSNARAERIEIAGGAVRAVEVVRLDPVTRQPQGRLRIESERVCVAGGVLASGALLQESGVAGAGPGVQLHSSAFVHARFAEPVHAYFGPTMAYAVTEFADVNGATGPGFMLENAAVSPITAASSLPGFGADHARAMAALPHLARTVVVLRDRTRGEVSADATGPAGLDYRPVAGDLERMVQGLGAMARAYLAAGAQEVFLPVNGVAPVRSEKAIAAFEARSLSPRDFSLYYAVHLFGGAVMGGRRDASALREDGRAWDVRGLYVSDASALPSNTGVNPQVTILSNALRVAGEMEAAG